MAKHQYELATHTFAGGRFEDHGIDLDVLPDLLAYKTLLVETAKELWRRNNPGRQRLPRNFEDSLVLKFYEIRPGSAAVPLMRVIETGDQYPIPETVRDELDNAVELVADTVDAAASDLPLPEAFPRSVIPLFENYGKTLRQDEYFEQRPFTRSTPSRYTATVRDRLFRWTGGIYEDCVDLTGEIRLADLDGGNFALRLPDGTRISGKFAPEQEAKIIEALREHTSHRLHIKGVAEFLPEGRLKRIASIESLLIETPGAISYDPTAQPIWKVAESIAATVPEEEWARLPSDLSKNVDHYLYGVPREAV